MLDRLNRDSRSMSEVLRENSPEDARRLRAELEERWRTECSEAWRVERALWVLSKAAAAKPKKPLERRLLLLIEVDLRWPMGR